jgi:hypothetical protein
MRESGLIIGQILVRALGALSEMNSCLNNPANNGYHLLLPRFAPPDTGCTWLMHYG